MGRENPQVELRSSMSSHICDRNRRKKNGRNKGRTVIGIISIRKYTILKVRFFNDLSFMDWGKGGWYLLERGE